MTASSTTDTCISNELEHYFQLRSVRVVNCVCVCQYSRYAVGVVNKFNQSKFDSLQIIIIITIACVGAQVRPIRNN